MLLPTRRSIVKLTAKLEESEVKEDEDGSCSGKEEMDGADEADTLFIAELLSGPGDAMAR